MTTLPDGWSLASLSDVASWGSGGTPQAGHAAFYGGDIPWAIIGDLNEATVLKTRASITDAGLASSSAKLVPEGAVLIAMYGSIGKLGIAGRPMATNQAIAFAVPNRRVLDKYLFYYLMSQRHQLDAAGKGATQRNISQTILRSWPILFPDDLDEQRWIVDILEDHLSRLDAAERALERVRLLTNGLQLSGLKSLVSQAEGRMTTLGEVATWGSGGTPLARTKAYYEGGTIPWVNSGDLRDGELTAVPGRITQRGFEKSAAKWVPAGAVLVAMYGATIGRLAIANTAVTTNQAVAHAVPLPELDASFLFWYLRSQRGSLVAAGKGGAQPNISQSILKAWPIQVPSLAVQRNLVERAKELHAGLQRLDGEVQRASKKHILLKHSLLAAAFSGRLTGRISDMEMVEEMAGV